MQIRDTIQLDAEGLKLTKDGYLVGDAKVSRAGNVQDYLGFELGLTDARAMQVFGVYRDPAVVFDEDSMMSLAGRPVTRDHPTEPVSASNWRDLAKGQLASNIRRDGEHVVAPMAIMDGDAAREVADGARMLSAGYEVGIVARDGVGEDGKSYQYAQTGPLRYNHVAYLPNNNPRAGNTRIGDAAPSAWRIGTQDAALFAPVLSTPKTSDADPAGQGHRSTDGTTPKETSMETMQLDGVPIQVADAAAKAVIEKAVKDAGKAVAVETKRADDAEAALARAEGERDGFKTKAEDAAKALADATSPEAIAKAVTDRATVETAAKRIAPNLKTDGLDADGIRKAALVAAKGDAAVEGRTADGITGMFDAMVDGVVDAKPDQANAPARALGDATNDTWDAATFARAGVSLKQKAA